MTFFQLTLLFQINLKNISEFKMKKSEFSFSKEKLNSLMVWWMSPFIFLCGFDSCCFFYF